MFPKIVGFPPKSSILIGFIHHKPSILGYPDFWKHPHGDSRKISTSMAASGGNTSIIFDIQYSDSTHDRSHLNSRGLTRKVTNLVEAEKREFHLCKLIHSYTDVDGTVNIHKILLSDKMLSFENEGVLMCNLLFDRLGPCGMMGFLFQLLITCIYIYIHTYIRSLVICCVEKM